MKDLTDRQAEVLAFIVSYIAKNHRPPVIRDIGEAFEISLNGVQGHLAALRKAGAIDWEDGKSRTLRVLTCEDGVS